jgi:hemerythrin-like domain-containing protein
MSITDPLRTEHRHLMSGVEALRHAGDLVGAVSHEAGLEATERALSFVQRELVPHAENEEEFLYPKVAEALGGPRSTETMARDHAEVKRLAGQLARAAEEDDEPMMSRLLYGLYHVIELHFAKEEEIYLPLLEETLNKHEAEELFRRMHAA